MVNVYNDNLHLYFNPALKTHLHTNFTVNCKVIFYWDSLLLQEQCQGVILFQVELFYTVNLWPFIKPHCANETRAS